MPTVTLPNGLSIEAVNDVEAQTLYREIFELETYDQQGIILKDGDCVFDVGANIGLYTLKLAQSCPNLRIVAFEPIPALFTILKRNCDDHATKAKLFSVALGDKRGSATFEYNPYSTISTSMRPADFAGAAKRDARWWEWFQAGITDLYKIGRLSAGSTQSINGLLATPILRWLLFIPFAVYVIITTLRNRLVTQRIDCSVSTISDILRENNFDHIDLLKIDVEGSEAEVIAGIAEDDWAKISQMVVEVHDVQGRVEALRVMLEDRCYHVKIAQEDWALHRLLGIYTLYAKRDIS